MHIDPPLKYQQELLAEISKLEIRYKNELEKDIPFEELKKVRMEIKRFQQMLADLQQSHTGSMQNETPPANSTPPGL
jgi:hypothetical protein